MTSTNVSLSSRLAKAGLIPKARMTRDEEEEVMVASKLQVDGRGLLDVFLNKDKLGRSFMLLTIVLSLVMLQQASLNTHIHGDLQEKLSRDMSFGIALLCLARE